MVSEIDQVQNLLGSSRIYDEKAAFISKQTLYLPDSNNGNYYSNIVFDTFSLTNQFTCPAEWVFAIPLQIQSNTATAYTSAAQVALKTFVGGLIYQVIMSIGGSQLLNETNIDLTNFIRVLIDSNSTFLYTQGPLYHIAKDTFNSVDPTTNTGFNQRITFLQNQSTFSAGVFSWTAFIPARFVHNLLKNIDFIVFGFRIVITLITTWQSTSSVQSFLTNTATTPIAKITVGGGPWNQCRLYYKSLVLQPTIAKQVAQKYSSHFHKTVQFISCDVNNAPNVPSVMSNSTTSQINIVLTQNAISPLRIFVLMLPTGARNSQIQPLVSVGSLTNVQIMLYNKPVYPNVIQTTFEQWQMLSSQFINGGDDSVFSSLISYSDFVNPNPLYRILCIDLKNLNTTISPSEQVNLTLQAQRAESSPAAVDYYIVVERKNEVTFNFAQATCTASLTYSPS